MCSNGRFKSFYKKFFHKPISKTNSDYKAAAAEGTRAYHTVKHQQSFFSNDCTSQLFKAIFPDSGVAKKFASAKTKTASIITGALAPYAQKKLLFDLGTQPFSVDASNHNEVKLFSLVIRFFNAKAGVTVRLLDLRATPGETSEQIMNFILFSVKENELDLQLLTSFCADNAPVNFGGCNQGGKAMCFIILQREKRV